MPMSASVVINRAELVALVDDLDQGISQAMTEASAVIAERDAVIDDARRTADQLLREAESERDRLASDTEVFQVAKRQAEETLAKAEAEAEGLRKEIDEYVESKLANFEVTLERTTEAVKRGRERLAHQNGRYAFTDEEIDAIRLPEHLEG